MIIIERVITETIYIEDSEIEKRAEDWDMSVEEIVNDLENGDLDCDDFVHFSDQDIEIKKVIKD